MFEKIKFFRGEQENPTSDQEILAKKLIFAFDSEQDFKKARQITEGISDEQEKEKLLAEISEIEHGKTPKFIEEIHSQPNEMDLSDVEISIEGGNFKDAKKQASLMIGFDEYWASRAYMDIAKAEFKKGINPQGTLAKAKEVARNIEDDPRHQVRAFAEIVKLEADCGLLNDARETTQDIKKTAKQPNWPEYNANVYAIMAQIEKNLGFSTEEIKQLDENTIDDLLKNQDPNISAAIKKFRLGKELK